MFDGQGRQVRLIEPVDWDAVIFDTIPPELSLSAWGDFPIVGHGGGGVNQKVGWFEGSLKGTRRHKGEMVCDRERASTDCW